MYTVSITERQCGTSLPQELQCSFLQTDFWASFKTLYGWKARRYIVNVQGHQSFSLIVLIKQIFPFGLLAYIPMGPSFLMECPPRSYEAAQERAMFLVNLVQQLVRLLPKNVFMLRFDPPWESSVSNRKDISASLPECFPLTPVLPQDFSGFTDSYSCCGIAAECAAVKSMQSRHVPYRVVLSPIHIQPPDTVQLDLTLPEETLLSQCKQKWRYNIRLAQKKGVAVSQYSGQHAADTAIPVFYQLYIQTAARDGIAVHSEAYYHNLCTLAASSSNTENIRITVYIAAYEGIPIASIITLCSPCQAVYLYGASSNEKRSYMPAYLLQWHAICDAKAYGCKIYDFYGIPPSEDHSHPMYGLYRFKTGFGGSIIHRVGSIDIPVCSVRYRLYIVVEKIRTFWFKVLKKKLTRLRQQYYGFLFLQEKK